MNMEYGYVHLLQFQIISYTGNFTLIYLMGQALTACTKYKNQTDYIMMAQYHQRH